MAKPSRQVSVIIPVYNSQRYLQSALDSVLAQSFDDFDVIVVDDGSETDACAQVVVQTQQSVNRPIRYIRQVNQGPAAARNRGLSASNAEFVAFLDSDDSFEPDKLTLQVRLITHLPHDYAFVTGGRRQFSQARPSKSKLILPPLLDGNIYHALVKGDVSIPWTPGAHLFRRDALTAVGGFDAALHYGEDKELLIRLARKFNVRTHRDVVFCRRVHAVSLSASLDQDILLKDVAYLVNKLERSDPDLPRGVLKGIQQTDIVSATIRYLSQQEDRGRAVALMKKAARRTDVSISWRAWVRIVLAYVRMLGRRLGRVITRSRR